MELFFLCSKSTNAISIESFQKQKDIEKWKSTSFWILQIWILWFYTLNWFLWVAGSFRSLYITTIQWHLQMKYLLFIDRTFQIFPSTDQNFICSMCFFCHAFFSLEYLIGFLGLNEHHLHNAYVHRQMNWQLLIWYARYNSF